MGGSSRCAVVGDELLAFGAVRLSFRKTSRTLSAVMGVFLATAAISCEPSAPGASGHPNGRSRAAAAFDAAHGQVVMFGGGPVRSDGSTAELDDTWLWSAGGWSEAKPARVPPKRAGAAMAYDPDTHLVVMVGGHAESHNLTDTWLWDGQDWSKGGSLPVNALEPNPVLTYDVAHHTLLLVMCCSSAPSGASLVATWTGDGRNWTAKHTLAPINELRAASVAVDPSTGHVVLITPRAQGFIDSATWEWDGIDWHKGNTAGGPPVPFDISSITIQLATLIALSPADKRVVALPSGGAAKSQWLFDGREWVASDRAGAAPFTAALVTDIPDGVVLQVGGASLNSDTDVVLARSSHGWSPAPAPHSGNATRAVPIPKGSPYIVVRSARDYFSSLVGLPPGYRQVDAKRPTGPGEPAGVADAWELIFAGQGGRLIVVTARVFNTPSGPRDVVTSNNADELNAQGVTTRQLDDPDIGDGASLVDLRGTLTDVPINVEAQLMAWWHGPIAFSVLEREPEGRKLTTSTLLALAHSIDQRTQP